MSFYVYFRFRSIARSYFRKAHGVLLLYDVTSESSFLNVRAWVDQIQVTAVVTISCWKDDKRSTI